MGPIGTPELIIVLVIVLLVFGIGRVSKLGSELGKGVSSFRKGLREGQAELAEEEKETAESEA